MQATSACGVEWSVRPCWSPGAITLDGRMVLLSVALGNRESVEAWRAFLRDLVERGRTGWN